MVTLVKSDVLTGTLTVRLGETLRRAIAAGYPARHKTAERGAVGRSPWRQQDRRSRSDLSALRADGLVEAKQGAGVFVLEAAPAPGSLLSLRDIDPARVSSMIELLELRTAIEVEAAGLAALRRSPAQEEVIIERHYAIRACLDAGLSSAEADFSLHVAIADATNNPRFREFLTMIGKNAIPRAALRENDSETDQRAYVALLDSEHNQIVVAISNGDEESAREAMRRHLRGSQARYRALLREQRKPV